ncbi:5'-methylthioadenosine/adenosylhomocysteine nucleosidase [Halalkalibacter sp. APA_J-10(15)]|uniref:5'-methylthioadenosine/adenosylhomocysteine nucleosidase n=1 Tax=unclassified Halalkalibacter TaxID=2893063 RepID=UPI001FF5F8ED|nr:5'-methylthioadenosine/adenosylhomocysteine nucleosidase [Halalkalibacter sp. APA_J-10(15)]MCK0471293.1 5'-methylthioadenosine/adenosylhomocysteine nucleosidase [Halalkalibacter sp. APA_J-10(15)]
MKIAIIGAMAEEITALKEEMTIHQSTEVALIQFYEGKMSTKDIVLCQSGVGKVNAALTTQVLIDHFQVTHILFTGVAGAVEEQLEVGDIIISTSAMQHDIDASPLGFKRGEIPMFPISSDFKANTELIKLAEESSTASVHRKVLKGRVVSGDQFIANAELVRDLRDTFNAVCVEMEGSAVAQVATLNNIPFVIIRSISDKANGEASMSFTEFTELASEQSRLIVSNMIKNMS